MKIPRRLIAVVLVLTAFTANCSRSTPNAAPPMKRRYGELMGEVGRRFELAGRAATANRFELAAFEVGEIGELFAQLHDAEPPKEGTTAILPPMVDAFTKTNLPELTKAAADKDTHAFAAAFTRAATECNACHQASGHGFVQIPTTPGKPVPDLDPVPLP